MIFDREDIDLPIPPPIEWFGLTDREYDLYLKWAYEEELLETEEEEVRQVAPQPQGFKGMIKKIRGWLFDPPERIQTPLVLTEAIIGKGQRFEEACEEYQAGLEDFLRQLGEIGDRDRLEVAGKRRHEDFWLSLDWRGFEIEVGLLYSDLGYSVEISHPYADDGIDAIASNQHERIMIQCKKHQQPIGPKVVDEVYYTMHPMPRWTLDDRPIDRFDRGLLVGIAGFTDRAVEFVGMINQVESENIDLLSLEELIECSYEAKQMIEAGLEPGEWCLNPSPKCPNCRMFMIPHGDRWRCSVNRCRGWRAKRD